MTRILLLAIPLALIWMALNNNVSLMSFIVGYAFSVGILLLVEAHQLGRGQKFRFGQLTRLPKQVVMLIVYAGQLALDIVLSGFDVARRLLAKDVTKTTAPDFVIIDTDTATDDWLISALSAHAITITPGSLVVDYMEEDGKTLMLVHVLDKHKWTKDVLQAQQDRRWQQIRGWLGHDDE